MIMAQREYVFDTTYPLQYRWSGKFVAGDSSWIHMERQLVDYELIVMEKGTLYLQAGDTSFEVREGEYLLMGPGTMQKGWKNSKCRFYWMHFWPSDRYGQPEEKTAADDRVKMTNRICLPEAGMIQNPQRLFVLMKQLQDCDLRYMDKTMNGYLAMAVLCELWNQCSVDTAQEETSGDLKQKVDDYILEHISTNLSLSDLAKHFGYHEKYFATLFKEKTGSSVKRYVDARKMERARYLLINTDAWVAEIAEHLGYENIQNFYHVFKKETDCTPSEYRAMYSKKYENDV